VRNEGYKLVFSKPDSTEMVSLNLVRLAMGKRWFSNFSDQSADGNPHTEFIGFDVWPSVLESTLPIVRRGDGLIITPPYHRP
jgi:hypothetical protein